jgi:hypothetical protein
MGRRHTVMSKLGPGDFELGSIESRATARGLLTDIEGIFPSKLFLHCGEHRGTHSGMQFVTI